MQSKKADFSANQLKNGADWISNTSTYPRVSSSDGLICRKITKIKTHSKRIMLADSVWTPASGRFPKQAWGIFPNGATVGIHLRHNAAVNTLLWDAHVSPLRSGDLADYGFSKGYDIYGNILRS